MKKRLWLLLLPLGGVLTALTLIFPRIGFLEWFALIPSLLFLFGHLERKEAPLRRYYALGLLFFFSFFFTVFHWFLRLYPMEFAGVTKGEAVVLVLICWIGLSLLQTVIAAFSFPLFAFLWRSEPVRRVRMLTPFLFAAVYTVFEWGQTLGWFGVPWARLPLGQANCGVLWNSAALFGSYFLTFALVAVNGLAAYAILHLDRVRAAAIACAAVFLINLAAGAVGYLTAGNEESNSITVAAVQGNVGSSVKWGDGVEKSFEIYEKYTALAVEQGAELILFPETFIPHYITETSALGHYVSGLAERYDVTILCGAFHQNDEGLVENAVFAFFPDGSISDTVYAKRRLVPFGEYVPMREVVEFLVPPLADIGMLTSDLAQGEGSQLISTEQGEIGALICFDSIYEELTLDSVRDGATLLCLPTNDSWFMDSAAVFMHLRQAQLRAIESGRYIVRSADTGVSAIISPDGKTAAEVEPLVEGMSLSTVRAIDTRTLYSYIGNLFVYLLLGALAVLTSQKSINCFKKKK